MNNYFEPHKFKIGIVGGGQLGKMLIQAGTKYNLYFATLDPDENAVCVDLANEFTCGSLTDFDTVYNFGKDKDVITIEIENVNIDALKKLQQEGKKVFPQPEVIEVIQDKGLQKQFYKNNNIPTSPFLLIEDSKHIANSSFTFPCFQKLRKGGYDGKGVVKLNSVTDLSQAFQEPSLLEQLVDFEKELSVIVARNSNGEIKCFPPVECEFNAEANLVEFLFSPATITNDVAKEVERIAIQVAEKLNIVGLLAVEYFLTKDGQVLVNECAPRPHNSGHQTIEGNFVSQFEQHLRAILNLPLGDTSTVNPSVMINLLGEKNYSGDAKYQGFAEALKYKGVYLHLYGKKTTKPFRKMGHITVVNASLNQAKSTALELKELVKVIA
ncbi:MAG: 5-(carboxyamino)imidazole ribonucleotide synthase [Bacteroidia bacterium]